MNTHTIKTEHDIKEIKQEMRGQHVDHRTEEAKRERAYYRSASAGISEEPGSVALVDEESSAILLT